MRELRVDEVEIVLDRVQVAAGLIDLRQCKLAFARNARGRIDDFLYCPPLMSRDIPKVDFNTLVFTGSQVIGNLVLEHGGWDLYNLSRELIAPNVSRR